MASLRLEKRVDSEEEDYGDNAGDRDESEWEVEEVDMHSDISSFVLPVQNRYAVLAD